jgi:phospholipid-transporting ATPase
MFPEYTTLAIGDGANDVPMILKANIGVGITGKEGTQAALSADFAIGQFKFLKTLMFTHGRECYRRNSDLVCYSFYKSLLYVTA